jgi:hypothetical protein
MWEKGTSGNPTGRPPGRVDKRHELRKILEDQSESLVKKAAEMALAGDGQMMRACLERLVPAFRAKDVPLVIPEAIDGSLVQMGEKVMKLVSEGELTPDEGAALSQIIAAHARMVETEDLAKRIAALEAKNANT